MPDISDIDWRYDSAVGFADSPMFSLGLASAFASFIFALTDVETAADEASDLIAAIAAAGLAGAADLEATRHERGQRPYEDRLRDGRDGYDAFRDDVLAELDRARVKFPTNRALIASLTEELGELFRALTDQAASGVWDEAVQAAAMTIRLYEEGDETLTGLQEWRA